MKLKYLSAFCALAAASGVLPAAAETCPRNSASATIYLSSDEAVQRALAADLRPAAARAGVATARSERAIAALPPADTITIDYENFPGLGLGSEIDNLEVTATFNRVWERGGKRNARIALAETSVILAEAEIAISVADVAHEVQTLYVELAITLERLALAEDRLEAAQAAERVIGHRVAAARDPLLAGARARADALTAESEAMRLAALADELKAALWDHFATPPDDQVFEVDLCGLSAKSSHAPHTLDASQSPELARLSAARRQADTALRLAEAERVADITWSAGTRKMGIDESLAVIGGVSIPLGAASRAAPLEQKAASVRRQTEAQADAFRQNLLRESARLERAALNALEAVKGLEGGAIPEAERSVELANDGYARGAFSYLDVLDAQRLLFDLRDKRLDLIRTYHLSEAALARLHAANLPASLQESSR
ncbi:TolC family protein [Hyphomonas sp. NPDC076900]|uniref:TolC family protein n=1 Tax=unclassified Hyphomonas TaxID=2630699 RepID=UPI003D030082